MNRRRRQVGPVEFLTGPCRTDRLSWFSFGPAGTRTNPVGFSVGGPRRYLAVLWLPAVRRDAQPAATS